MPPPLRCGKACRHVDFEPLLRHTGSLPHVSMPDLANLSGWQPASLGSIPPPALVALPEIEEGLAQRLLRNHILYHTKFMYGRSNTDRQLYGGMPRPEGIGPDDLLYRPLEVRRDSCPARWWYSERQFSCKYGSFVEYDGETG